MTRTEPEPLGRRTKLTILVGGLIGRAPVGGWHYLQYVAGLAGLGHDVYYHEDTWCWPYHPIKKTYTDDPNYSVRYLNNFFTDFVPELSDHWHYVHLHDKSYGMQRARFDEVAASADVFLNVGGACMLPEALAPDCVKVFIDTDPGYNQIVFSEKPAWSENVERWCKSIEAHDEHFTYAENIHGDDCGVPMLHFDWKTTRPPVVMDLWEPLADAAPPEGAPWSTIMTWNPFKGRLLYRGKEYGGKAAEFEKLLDLPNRTKRPFEVAIGGVDAPSGRLAEHGWRTVDGPSATLSPRLYRYFLERSRGEISCAKQVYVALRTGWFSERTAVYLACGRPAVVQDTGFSKRLGTGKGLLAFETAEEAGWALDAVERDYWTHSLAARKVAATMFSADKVLSRLLDELGRRP